jgi:hypothetical protein
MTNEGHNIAATIPVAAGRSTAYLQRKILEEKIGKRCGVTNAYGRGGFFRHGNCLLVVDFPTN